MEKRTNICNNCKNKALCGVTITGDFTIDECTGYEEIEDINYMRFTKGA